MITFIYEKNGLKVRYEVKADGRTIGGGVIPTNKLQEQVNKYRNKGYETELIAKDKVKCS
jgi:hypothetical protein